MDDKKIRDILHKLDIPEHDPNAQKRALNLALVEFEATKKINEKKSQGNSILARLMSVTQQNKGHKTMEQIQKKKFIYGGMATAMAVVLIAGVSLTQMQSGIFDAQGDSAVAELNAPKLNKVEFNVDNAASPAMTTTPGTEEASPAYVTPIPTEPPVGRIVLNEEQDQAGQRVEAKKEHFAADMAQAEMEMAPAYTQGKSGIVASAPAVSAQRMIAPISPPIDTINPYYQDEGRDKFEDFKVNPIKMASEEPVSTFSVDVDTASYSFMRRQLNHGTLPADDAVRVEELINYFDYDYAVPDNKEAPFKATVTVTPSPWADGKELIHIGIKGYEIEGAQPRSNLVFLLDTSGSMNSPDKLPLLKNSLKLLLDTLKPDDTVAIAAYAGSAGTVLEPTKVAEKNKIIAALDNLNAGGGTAGAAGIELAYNLAQENFDEEAVNRVILATDGDFNVGISDPEALKEFVEKKRESGVFLSVFGFGQGNYNDHMMQALAQNGNGVAAYIDTLSEARKVLVEEATSSLFPIAKDVKIQVEFNPDLVSEYRLIGYETRSLAREDFNNDKIDAGDIGAGHTVTAIYEITPVGSKATSVDALRYGAGTKPEKAKATTDFGGEYAFLKMRYKLPNEDTSKLITTPITSDLKGEGNADTKFATAVAAYGQMLKGGKYTTTYSYDDVIKLAQAGKGVDEFGYRTEFINLVRLAKSLDSTK